MPGAITKGNRNNLMESGLNNTRLYCLTIAFVSAVMAFALGSGTGVTGDTSNVLLFLVWATFIPWLVVFVILPIKPRSLKL